MPKATAASLRWTVEPCNLPPLGAHQTDGGITFSIASRHADVVELCLFDTSGQEEIARLRLPNRTGDIWHGYVPNAQPGQRYGYRIHGPYDPDQGHWFNPQKLLVDPLARAIERPYTWHESQFTYQTHPNRDLRTANVQDSAPFVPKGIVMAAAIKCRPRPGPMRPWSETVIYEAHVKGLTALHLDIPEHQRGRISALANPVMLRHFKSLGITAVELMPITPIVHETGLIKRGLVNYWGYNPLCWSAIDPRYLTPGFINEFQNVVDTLHAEGIEIILDMVFNHSGESDEYGPTLGLRGIDNKTYYQLPPHDLARYVNDSGCGNTLRSDDPLVVQMVVESLRYWAIDMGVDGFRLDLAVSLGKHEAGFAAPGSALAAIMADADLHAVKLLAEPWDATPEGYALGTFPHGWREWNDRYRDDVRRYWRSDSDMVRHLATRLAGSEDIFLQRTPLASINFITSHDGFTLADLVQYSSRHNHANGENNHDGHAHEISWNNGIEGPTSHSEINQLRTAQSRALLSTLLLSQGVPMLLMGDELGRSQNGNNNAYPQDNASSWIDWPYADNALKRFVRHLIRIRRRFSVFHRTSFFPETETTEIPQIDWLKEDGSPMAPPDWMQESRRTLACLLYPYEQPVWFLLLFNAQHKLCPFVAPKGPTKGWRLLLSNHAPITKVMRISAGTEISVPAAGFYLLAGT